MAPQRGRKQQHIDPAKYLACVKRKSRPSLLNVPPGGRLLFSIRYNTRGDNHAECLKRAGTNNPARLAEEAASAAASAAAAYAASAAAAQPHPAPFDRDSFLWERNPAPGFMQQRVRHNCQQWHQAGCLNNLQQCTTVSCSMRPATAGDHRPQPHELQQQPFEHITGALSRCISQQTLAQDWQQALYTREQQQQAAGALGGMQLVAGTFSTHWEALDQHGGSTGSYHNPPEFKDLCMPLVVPSSNGSSLLGRHYLQVNPAR